MNTSQRRTAVAIVLVMSLIVASVTLFNLPAAAQTNEGAAKEVIALAPEHSHG